MFRLSGAILSLVLVSLFCFSALSHGAEFQNHVEELRQLLRDAKLSIDVSSVVNLVSIYCSSSSSSSLNTNHAIMWGSTQFSYTFGRADNMAIATGIIYDGYSPTFNNQTSAVDGWMRLWVNTFTSANRGAHSDACYRSEANQRFASGMAEGLLTQPQIYNFFQNQYSNWVFAKKTYSMDMMRSRFGSGHEWVKSYDRLVSSSSRMQQQEIPREMMKRGLAQSASHSTSYYYPAALIAYMQDNMNWLETQVQQNPQNAYWIEIERILNQFHGLVEGYTIRANTEKNEIYGKLNWLDLYFLNSAGDMETLEGAIKDSNENARSASFKNNGGIVLPDEETLTDCSALIKITPDCRNLFAGHTTWRGFNIINKMYKVYSLMEDGIASQTVAFASSPSFLSSKDDFYVTQHGLVTMETTNDVFNTNLFQFITPHSVMCWMRSIVANRLAKTAHEWVTLFGLYNSGTYNNQWMALDYNKFTPGQCQLPSDSLWILEQIPGTVMTKDVTPILNNQTFWSSYNIPYFEFIYNISGYPQAKEKFGNDYDYNLCSRAQIFRREQAKIGSNKGKPVDFKDFGRVLQFNEWKTDQFSNMDPSKSISSRYDLRVSPQRAFAFGGIDTKVADYTKVKKSTSMWGICGPTHQDPVQTPPFSWSDKWNVTHLGQPQTYDFDWVDLEDVESFYESLKNKLFGIKKN
ncbi:hypothetical protein C9374_003445 [Naegleria lovaniensis]|uniref:Phospholipase B-like n=1 Tax=Naegleria lovaniensis TaxID=51637 RepID=A0AA88KJH3_NAELO|nr:uncharacterized protein C9374_003445 [Naegleria lovaniensis]KAG2385630.1 hypothetical protein C9374_003445 [Naegleria lovaniensis]